MRQAGLLPIVYTQATNKKGQTYIVHPDSSKQIVGFVIPQWDMTNFCIQNNVYLAPTTACICIKIKSEESIDMIKNLINK